MCCSCVSYLIGQNFSGQICRKSDLLPKILSAEIFCPLNVFLARNMPMGNFFVYFNLLARAWNLFPSMACQKFLLAYFTMIIQTIWCMHWLSEVFYIANILRIQPFVRSCWFEECVCVSGGIDSVLLSVCFCVCLCVSLCVSLCFSVCFCVCVCVLLCMCVHLLGCLNNLPKKFFHSRKYPNIISSRFYATFKPCTRYDIALRYEGF